MVARKAQRAARTEPVPIPTTQGSSARPEVIVEFLFDRGLLFISVNNIGDRPALNVSVIFDKKIMGLEGRKEISALALFQNIEFLGPRREIVCLLDSSSSYFKRRQPTKILTMVVYKDLERHQYDVKIKHDLEIYRELPFLVPAKGDEEN
jgi:hypothetical protein